MRFLIKYSGLEKLLLYLRVVARVSNARNSAQGRETRSIPVGFADMRRQSYKKILNFEAYFVKISSIGAACRGIHVPLSRPYCR
jgi:hypothetical protein